MEEELPEQQSPLSVGKAVERVSGIVELLTTLDQKILRALDSLEEMQGRVASFDDLGVDGRELVADVKTRLAALDERLNRDLDDVKDALMAKIGELDLAGFGGRLDRLEAAVFNIERATVNLDRAFEGGLEMLPDFLTKRLKAEGDRSPTVDPHQP